MDELLREFLTETTETLDVLDNELLGLERTPDEAQALARIFRLLHSVKGTCGFLGLPRLESLAHAAETLLDRYREGLPVTAEGVALVLQTTKRMRSLLADLESSGAEPEGCDDELLARLQSLAAPQARPEPGSRVEEAGDGGSVKAVETARELSAGDAAALAPPSSPSAEEAPRPRTRAPASVRVQVETLDALMETVGELVLARNQLLEVSRRVNDDSLRLPLQRLSAVTGELQSGIMKARMQPIGTAWRKLPRLVHDLSQELGKPIALETRGGDTELDRQVLELIMDPLVHMLRNAADHGIEDAETRRRLGKPETGRITVSAHHEGSRVVLQISDDGRGIDAARVRAKAIELGLAGVAELDRMDERQLCSLIFRPGFTTANAVTSVSGRGVGLDVVRENIELIGGSLEVAAVKDRGTTFTIKIPLTLAIISALIVSVAGQRFALPQLVVQEVLRVQGDGDTRIESVKGADILRLRGTLVPLIALEKLLGGAGSEAAAAPRRAGVLVAVLRVGVTAFAVTVDRVCGSEEIVVKPLSRVLRECTLFSGNTILGDGNVALIIDPNSLARQVAGAGIETRQAVLARDHAPARTAQRRELLLFLSGSREPKAVPLASVMRIEEMDIAAAETCDGREVLQYRGALLPLVRLGTEADAPHGERPVLVLSDGDRIAGLIVDEIIDAVEETVDAAEACDKRGLAGTSIIQGRATEVIDAAEIVRRAHAGARAKQGAMARQAAAVLLIEPSLFVRDMLTPVIEAAGSRVSAAASPQAALRLVESGESFDVVVADMDRCREEAERLVASLAVSTGRRPMLIGLTSRPGAEARRRAQGHAKLIGKFDRQALLRSLAERDEALAVAA